MTLRVALALVAASLLVTIGPSRSAHADACLTKAEKLLTRNFGALHEVAKKATSASLRCLYRGADDKAVAKLEKEARAAYQRVGTTDYGTCPAPANLTELSNQVGHGVGVELGFMFAACSSTVVALRAKGLPEAEFQKQLEQLAAPFKTRIFGD